MNPTKSLTEYETQVKIFERVELFKYQRKELILLVGSLNGVRLHVGLRMKMKRAGCLNKGFPDLQLPVPLSGFHGLFIELKCEKPKGVLSAEQKAWLKVLNGYGYKAVACWGLEEAWETIINYLNGEYYDKAKES